MKTMITRKLLKQRRGAGNRPMWALIIVAAVFCALCIALIPVPAIGIAITVIVAAIVIGLHLKLRSIGGARNIDKAYLHLAAVTGKETVSENGHNDNGSTNDFHWQLRFGEGRNDAVAVKKDVYDSAEEGKLYYVAYYADNNCAFDCFDAAEYEPGAEIEVR